MEYYERLGLCREPFSNSPDPEFLYYSQQHIACLQELEIAVLLRRGLNVVIGDVGTGKTTLIRRFIKNMSINSEVKLHLVLDPYFATPKAFLRMLCAQVLGTMPDKRLNTYVLKELLKKELFRRGVNEDSVTVLLVDEGQKMTPECLEVLRELLNYETNSKKLLQILVFAQSELKPIISGMENFQDRINLYRQLPPLSSRDIRAMIEYRLTLATPPGEETPILFSNGAYRLIYKATKGYPRKAVRLCHKIILNLLIRKKPRATAALVRSVIREELQLGYRARPVAMIAAAAVVLLVVGLVSVRYVPAVRGLASGVRSSLASTFSQSGVEVERISLDPSGDDPFKSDTQSLGGGEELATVVFLGPSYVMTQSDAELSPEEIEEPDAIDMSDLAESSTEAVVPLVVQVRATSDLEPSQDGDMYTVPELFGAVTVMPKESLSVMIRRVYGVYDKDILTRVLAANPRLGNANGLQVGMNLRFPVIAPGNQVISENLSWLRLFTERELDQAYARVRTLSQFDQDSRLIPYLAADGVLAFAVVLERPFESREKAGAARSALPLALQQGADVMSSPVSSVTFAQMNELAWGVYQAMLEQ